MKILSRRLHARQLVPPFLPAIISRTMAAVPSRKQPPWSPPTAGATPHPKLHVYNSLTRSKVPFVPSDPEGKRVTWYACGPTVYDDAHLGHARNYVSTDILRRILRDYFGFQIKFVMNITDVDDKIILRGRQQHLLHEYVKRHDGRVDDQVLELAGVAFHRYIRKNLPLIGDDAQPVPDEIAAAVEKAYGRVLRDEALDVGTKVGDKEAKIRMYVNTITSAVRAMDDTHIQRSDPDAFYAAVQDLLSPLLDEREGSGLPSDDHSIFTHLTRKFEERFFRDMRELNVLDPDELTRVTEYGSQIATFVDKIVENRFGYPTSDGSVYFDIDGFEAAGNSYARLEPWNRGNNELQADGEGALSQNISGKRSAADFAVWKASKPGEPSWPSKWGPGRPGWHIECSAMASAKLGKQMDIHSGGIDLAFPHHDNELAQSEAYWSDGKGEQWVNYFLHMGHLSIAGSKMSKSLKNFTTIRSALEKKDWTPRSLRILFLLGGWKDGVEITDDLVQAGSGWEDRIDNFFLNAKSTISEGSTSTKNDDPSLRDALQTAESDIYDALCDSFNTPKAMTIIGRLVGDFNSADRRSLLPILVAPMAKWVTKMVNIFGLNGTATIESDQIGWSGIDVPPAAVPYVFPLSRLRDDLRRGARSKEGFSKEYVDSAVRSTSTEDRQVDTSSQRYANVLQKFKSDASSISSSSNLSNEILALCDRVRDIDLWNLNIYLEDRDSQPALVRAVTAALAAARQERDGRAQQKESEKAKRDQQAKEKAGKGRISHTDMFRTGEFSAWDVDGLPTKMANGDEVAKSRSKKLRKDWERQKKAHEAWKTSSNEV